MRISYKIRLLFAKIEGERGNYKEAMGYLWDNFNSSKVIISMYMNDLFYAKTCEDPKLIKEAKYFIVNLMSMTSICIQSDAIMEAFDCLKTISWIVGAFFEKDSKFYKYTMQYCKRQEDIFMKVKDEKNEMDEYFEYLVNNHFDVENVIDFYRGTKEEKDLEKIEISKYGYMPENGSKTKKDAKSDKNSKKNSKRSHSGVTIKS